MTTIRGCGKFLGYCQNLSNRRVEKGAFKTELAIAETVGNKL